MVGLTLIAWVGWAETGAEMVETVRSGPITIDFARVLLISLVSKTAFGSSAFAMMYQVPVAVPAGIVTLAEPGLLPAEGIAPVDRLFRSVSPAPRTASDEK